MNTVQNSCRSSPERQKYNPWKFPWLFEYVDFNWLHNF